MRFGLNMEKMPASRYIVIHKIEPHKMPSFSKYFVMFCAFEICCRHLISFWFIPCKKFYDISSYTSLHFPLTLIFICSILLTLPPMLLKGHLCIFLKDFCSPSIFTKIYRPFSEYFIYSATLEIIWFIYGSVSMLQCIYIIFRFHYHMDSDITFVPVIDIGKN